jgi:hypothetical protein
MITFAPEEVCPDQTNDAELCRLKGWGPGDMLVCAETVSEEHPKFVRLTAIGECLVLGHKVNSDATEGPEEVVTLVPHAWRKISLKEWKGLQDTRVA